MPISNELIDQLLKDCHAPQDLLGEGGLLKELTKRLPQFPNEMQQSESLVIHRHEFRTDI